MKGMAKEARDNAKEFDAVFQDKGDIFVMCVPDDVMMIPRDNLLALLTTVLFAIRTTGDAETADAAAKACMASLGRGRFR